MTDLSKEEARALSQDELELVSSARHPGLREMSDRALADLIRRLRERRDRARDTCDRMHGQVEPAGVEAAAGNGGTRSKEHFLGAALARAMEERERRGGEEHAMQDRNDREDQGREQTQGGGQSQGQSQDRGQSQHDIAEKALEMRKEADRHRPEHPENTPEPDQGMQPNPAEDLPPPVQKEGYAVTVDRTRRPR